MNGGADTLRIAWRAPLPLGPSEVAGGDGALTLVADPRSDGDSRSVWAWHSSTSIPDGELVRLSCADGAVLERFRLPGALLNTPLVVGALPLGGVDDDGASEYWLLASLSMPSASCALVAMDLASHEIRWTWKEVDGSQGCAAGQIGLLDGGVLIFGRRDGGGVVALGNAEPRSALESNARWWH